MRALTSLVLLTTVAGVAFVATGCSSSAAGSAGAEGGGWSAEPGTSGTRLRARYLAGGGARELVGFFDTQRNEECTFQRAEEGRLRCLPKAALPSTGGGFFSDAACTASLAALPGACEDGAEYGLIVSYATCGGTAPSELRRIAPAPGARYRGSPDNCALQAPGQTGGPEFVALGEVVPWTDFVQGVETTRRGELVAEVTIEAADGARQHLGFHIDDLDADCEFQIMADGVTRCVPEGPSGQVVFTDPECTKAAYVVGNRSLAPCVPTAKLWREPENDSSCGGIRAVYSLGDDIEPGGGEGSSSVYGRVYGWQTASSPSCTSTTTSGAYNANPTAVRANITASLPSTNRVKSGSERLSRALVPGRRAGTLVPGWHDNERDTDCTFATASDGKTRCLPAAAQTTIFFTDATCKAPSRVAVLGEGGPCTGVPRFGLVTSRSCPPSTRVYGLTGAARNLATGSTETSPGRCATLAGVENALDAAEVDPADFVEGSAVTE
jgi:hypothetical protein